MKRFHLGMFTDFDCVAGGFRSECLLSSTRSRSECLLIIIGSRAFSFGVFVLFEAFRLERLFSLGVFAQFEAFSFGALAHFICLAGIFARSVCLV